eukprot:2049305-Lingulodinium_polyedra.AAC.1
MPAAVLRFAPQLSDQRLAGRRADDAANEAESISAKHPGGEGRSEVRARSPAKQHNGKELALRGIGNDKR